jgi:hypothetical protein
MNMRWAWTLPVLSLATTLVAGSAWAQGGSMAPTGGAFAGQGMLPASAAMDPSMAGGLPVMIPPAGMYPPGTAFVPAAGYPQAAMYQQPAYYPPQGIHPAAYMGGPAPNGAMQSMPAPMMAGPTPDVYGSYGYMPNEVGSQGGAPPGYGQPMYDPQGYGGGMDAGGGGPCPYCGGQGCDNCRGGIFGHGGLHGDGTWLPNGLLGDVLGLVAPYPDGGCAAVRWYDFAVDYLNLKRDNTGRTVNFATFGINGPVALSSDNLDFGSYKPGFRFSGAFQLGAANSLEFTYFGQFNFNTHATVRSPGSNLFSPFSQFGILPLGGGGGFTETDRADFMQINYTSQIDSFEINWRNRWMAPNCRYQGSWTLGVRHFILDEKLRYASSSSLNSLPTTTGLVPAQIRDDTDTTNNLTGLQIGTDMWVCLLPGLRVGGELQAGVYGNHMNINTTIGSNQVPNFSTPLRLNSNDVSFVGQANLLVTYRINYQWTLRGGYQFLFVDGVALATENFNPQPPIVNNPFTPSFATNDNGNIFLHGWNVGLEFMW